MDKDWVPKKNNPNKNRDSLYGDCPVPVGSPRDTNVEWYPLTEMSDCAQFFSDGIESAKDYLFRGEFNEEMLEDKNLNSEEYVISNDELWEIINWKSLC